MTLPQVNVSAGDRVHNFTVVRTVPIASMNLQAVELRHPKSGARMLHLVADDPENLFSIAFRTPPTDDTGLPHILEHSVLCGSKRYPVKDPFVELLKTSLATFLNAMTYPDRTVYPCSSMNAKDFHNLMRVYADAVFFPVLSQDHFRQEGHHYEFDPEGRLTIKGVVYNEMRGVYSDPEGLLDRHLQETLFSSNEYGHDYGGDPWSIPQLTYEQYAKFHQTYYHPSNAWIFTYGNVPLASTLEILDRDYLGKFDAIQLDSSISPLKRWEKPHHSSKPYPIDSGESTLNKTDIAVAWATNDRRDVLENLAMKTIDQYLLDNAASPLRKALIDSKLGEELGPSGHADHQRDTSFGVTLKGSEPERAKQVEQLILDTIRKECDQGFDPGKIEAALHRFELSAREIRPQYPLRLLERVFAAWLYDTDPLSQLDISLRLDELRKTLAKQPRYLENIARKQLVDNPHRFLLSLHPDPEYMARKEEDLARDMARRLEQMSAETRQEVAETAERLEAMQSEGNSPEALATLPRLAKTDVSPDPIPLDYSVEKVARRDFLRVPMYAGGIGYFTATMSLSGLAREEILLLPFLTEALGKTGAAGHGYAEMAEREAAVTGGLDFSPTISSRIDNPKNASLRLAVWMKALESDWGKALEVMSERLFQADFSDLDRLRDILLQARMNWRNAIVPSGNAYASLYAAQFLGRELSLSESLFGCTQARYVDNLATDLAKDGKGLAELAGRLAVLRDKILTGATPTFGLVGSDASVGLTRAWVERFASRFGGTGATQSLADWPEPSRQEVRIGIAAPSEIAYVARSLPAPALTSLDAPALVMLGIQLSYGYLWNEVRVKGGAYGVRAAFEGFRGCFNFSSYRDPNISATLGAYARVGDFIEDGMDLSPHGLEQMLIGAMKVLDVPMRPSSALSTAMSRHLSGETEKFRKDFRTRLLGLDAGSVRAAAHRLFSGYEGRPVCVLTSREKLLEENRKHPDGGFRIEALWDRGE